MAAGHSIGTIFVELDLDAKKYTAAQNRILQGARTTSLAVEKNWSTIGTQSDKMYDMMRLRIENAYAQIRNSGQKSSDELVRMEYWKAQQLKKIHDQQYNYMQAQEEKSTKMSRDSQAGWLSMMKGMLAYRAIMFGMQAAWEVTVGSIIKGIQKIDEFQTAQAAMAAAISSTDFKGSFDEAFTVAGNIITQVELLDRKFIGTADELRTLADSMLTYGMGIDLSTQKSQDQFVAFANMIKLLTRGQDFTRQAMQEVRSLMEGSNVQGAMLVKKIEAAGYNAKIMVPIWREQGVLLEKINEIMGGYGKAGDAIGGTWSAIKGTLETIYSKTLREGMAPIYKDILSIVRSTNDALLDQNGLTDKGRTYVDTLRTSWDLLKTSVLIVKGAIYAIPDGLDAIEKKLNALVGRPEELDEEFYKRTRGLGKWQSYLENIRNILDVITGKRDWNTGEWKGDTSGALADFYGSDIPTGASMKVPGSGRKSGESDADKKRIKDAEDLAKLRFNIAMKEAQELDAALILGNQLMDKHELDQIREQLKAKEKLNKEFADQAYKDAVADDQARIEGNAAMNLMELEAIREKIKQQKEAEKEAYETLKAFAVNAFNDMADTLANFVTTGKINFRDFIDSALADLTRLIVRMQMFNLLKSTGAIEFLTPAAVTKLPGMASGGPVTGGSPYMVGERGPEMFIPASSGSIVPNSGGGGSVTVNIRNDGGQQVAAKSAKASFDLQGAVIDIVIDGVQRNVHGLRYALGGA